MGNNYTVNEVIKKLHGRLSDYIEAQYHIADDDLIEERRLMLEELGIIAQAPYIEATPSYKLGKAYKDLILPQPVIDIFDFMANLSNPNVGIYPKPYEHQINAMDAFTNKGKELIVVTGTGSGKTECFLMPILSEIVLEAVNRPESYKKSGVRALILYPMNSLVSDQVSRLRRMYGDPRVTSYLKENYGRHIRFGMYTSRTPYPGPRTSKRDQKYIKEILDYYIQISEKTPELMKELKDRGRWPAKDLEAFYAKDKRFWKDRLVTSTDDTELFTRHEMQVNAPDLLITNYSMLEYMLMRPVERSIFSQTKEWLDSDKNNKFILVLDEAHMYRGASGAEVALLIRRLQSRLGIPRDRMHCILTSASIGGGDDITKVATQFAESLTSKCVNGTGRFDLISGIKEIRSGSSKGTDSAAQILADFNVDIFATRCENPNEAIVETKKLASRLYWNSCPSSIDELPEYLYNSLTGFAPMEFIIEMCSGNAIEFSNLSAIVFPDSNEETAQKAVSSLLVLGTAASMAGKVLLPTRLHLFYRGVPGIYACINTKCNEKRNKKNEISLLGKLYNSSIQSCRCQKKSRIYELITHRDCGCAFIKAYYRPKTCDFLWHEKGGAVGEGLREVHIFVGKPHREMICKVRPIWIDITTGCIKWERPDDLDDYLSAFWPNKNEDNNVSDEALSFEECPCCTKKTNNKIMGLGTKGEQPFANLVRQQILVQPPSNKFSKEHPNGGRKVLLFSDGRQKAARLARDIPREVELDTFRQAILLAARRLQDIGKESRLTKELYTAFVDVVSENNLFFFDGDSQLMLRRHSNEYTDSFVKHGDGLDIAIAESWDKEPPYRYTEALLKQLCHPYYSMFATSVAYIEPTKRAFNQLIRLSGISISEDKLRGILIIWVQQLIEAMAFNVEIHDNTRYNVASFGRNNWGVEGKIPKKLRDLLIRKKILTDGEIVKLQQFFYEQLCSIDNNGKYFISPDKVKLTFAANSTWYKCSECTGVYPIALDNSCPVCGSEQINIMTPDSPYMKARKGYWRNPVIAVIEDNDKPSHVTVEEHSAQLSQRDVGVVHATTEKYELRFQDIWLSELQGPVDVLSCTTTMEVGIDIGSLVAVALRNVPPARENYQQRAGRAGRRGSSVSTVITYSQGGPHDSHYFKNPAKIISGEPREPRIYINNKKIARRHVNALLLQSFFHGQFSPENESAINGSLMGALGKTYNFFLGNGSFTLITFKEWIGLNILNTAVSNIINEIVALLPNELFMEDASSKSPYIQEKVNFIKSIARELVKSLEEEQIRMQKNQLQQGESEEDDEYDEDHLLEYLFSKGLLPTYAFPTDLSSFYVERWDPDRRRVIIDQRPQQSMAKALSEYAPGRLIVIDKKTYRSGGIYQPNSEPLDKAKVLSWDTLSYLIYCETCSYIQESKAYQEIGLCPICSSELKIKPVLEPIGFSPEEGRALKENDREQEISYASSPQLPIPLNQEQFEWKNDSDTNFKYAFANDKPLVIVNKGTHEDGFDICTSCGCAWNHGDSQAVHKRPYLIDFGRAGGRPSDCSGVIRNVILGHSFKSDLLILRISLSKYIDYNPESPWIRDCLRTFAEVFALAASRTLDIDFNELNAGYRFVPVGSSEETVAEVDVYLFDTLSGGAGYAFAAGEQLDKVLENVYEILQDCNCYNSCYECIRNYNNQFYHNQLDRYLAADFVKYAFNKVIPLIKSIEEQAEILYPLKRMLELQGISAQSNASIGGATIPLLINRDGDKLAVGSHNPLLNTDYLNHSLDQLEVEGIQVYIENEYILKHDLPCALNNILSRLGL